VRGLREAVSRVKFTPEAKEEAFNDAVGIYDKVGEQLGSTLFAILTILEGSHLWLDSIDSRSCYSSHFLALSHRKEDNMGAVEMTHIRKPCGTHPSK
jgi:hypothetical protein